jgi:hypothetical protein
LGVVAVTTFLDGKVKGGGGAYAHVESEREKLNLKKLENQG